MFNILTFKIAKKYTGYPKMDWQILKFSNLQTVIAVRENLEGE